MPTIYFDLTTSISWGGEPVGITRVEREIAKRAKGRSSHPVRYCIFHMPTGHYYELQPAFADRILEGECWIARDAILALTVTEEAINAPLVSDIPSELPGPAAIAALHRRLDGLSLSEVLKLRATNPVVTVNSSAGSRVTSIGSVIRRRIPLKSDTWIINGGLDWEYKNLRHLRRLKEKKNFVYVAIIYDIIPLLYPQYVVPFYVDLLKRYFGELFWMADYAMCISATTRRDVEKHLVDWRMPQLRMADWPLGCDIESTSEAPGKLPNVLSDRSFLLYVSTIEPRKSHRTVVDAFEHGVRTGQIEDDAMCVFVGRVGWNVENMVQEVRTNPLLADRVLFLSGLSDNELLELYRKARFVVFPSRYEGYGLSLVEAMALGKACIASDAGSLREVGGEAPLYIDPFQVPRWAEAIVSAFKDDGMISELEQRSLSEYKPVTWDDSADLFYTALNRWIEPAK